MSAAKPLPDKRTSEANNSVSKSVSKRRNKAHMGCGRRRGMQAPRAEVSANSSSGADEWTAVTDKREQWVSLTSSACRQSTRDC